MIRFHGGPIKPTATAVTLWSRRHAMVSFAYQEQASLAFEVAQSVMLDNSAFTLWDRDEKMLAFLKTRPNWSLSRQDHRHWSVA